jgi:hypothetical protein
MRREQCSNNRRWLTNKEFCGAHHIEGNSKMFMGPELPCAAHDSLQLLAYK